MKRVERKRLKFLQDKYHVRAQAVNNNYDKFLKEADKFRMRCVEEIYKLRNQDKELRNLEKLDQETYKINQEKKNENI